MQKLQLVPAGTDVVCGVTESLDVDVMVEFLIDVGSAVGDYVSAYGRGSSIGLAEESDENRKREMDSLKLHDY